MAQDLSTTTASVDAAQIYRNTGSTFGSPTWASISNVQDLDVSDEATEANTTSKGANIGVVSLGYRNVAVNFKLVYVKGRCRVLGSRHGVRQSSGDPLPCDQRHHERERRPATTATGT